jgi:lysyl-tRNA synthetase class 1
VDPAADVAAEAAAFRPPFNHLAMLVQIPGVDVAARVAAEKGSPLTPRECAILDERVTSARAWLATYAPERAVVQVQETLPAAVEALDGLQRSFLATLAEAAGETPPTTGEGWQTAIFDVARALDLPAGRAFDAIYRAFLGRPNGPRAGWLLASLDPAFVVRRLREAA